MPLSDENAATFERATGRDVRFAGIVLYAEDIDALLNACRLEERAKAEARIAELTQEGEASRRGLIAAFHVEADKHEAALSRATQAERVGYLSAQSIAALDMRDEAAWASVVRRSIGAGVTVADMQRELGVSPHTVIAWIEGRKPPREGTRRLMKNALVDLIAKLKAAPLQGEGSSSASGVESAATRDQQPCCPQPPLSDGSGG